MSPPSAIATEAPPFEGLPNLAPTSALADGNEPKVKMPKLSIGKPTFDDKYKEREYLKGRLAAAFRIFGKYGFDEGVAGHITLRVRYHVTIISGQSC